MCLSTISVKKSDRKLSYWPKIAVFIENIFKICKKTKPLRVLGRLGPARVSQILLCLLIDIEIASHLSGLNSILNFSTSFPIVEDCQGHFGEAHPRFHFVWCGWSYYRQQKACRTVFDMKRVDDWVFCSSSVSYVVLVTSISHYKKNCCVLSIGVSGNKPVALTILGRLGLVCPLTKNYQDSLSRGEGLSRINGYML